MFSMRPAHFGILAFFTLLTIIVVAIVTHSIHPSVATCLLINDVVPAFALPDPSGETHEMDTPRVFYRIIVYAPNATLTAAQQKGLSDLVSSLAQDVPVNVVAITDRASHDITVSDVCPIASTLVVDSRRTLWQLTGENQNEASVCVVGPTGRLRLRSKLPPNGPITLADIQPSDKAAISDHALASIIAHIGGH